MLTDPTTVSCIITEPSGASTLHSYAGAVPADIVKVSTGKYTLAVPCSPSAAGIDGLWGFEWIGTGAVSDVQPGTWRVLPPAISQLWYVGAEEMKDRLGIALTDTSQDYALQTSIAASAGYLNEYCGRHFNRVTETRTYQPTNIWELDVDDIVPGTAITLKVDQDGDGVFEDTWTQGTDYQLKLGRMSYNVNASGTPRPYRKVQVLQSGKWFPYTWPYTHLDRVQIATTWGWAAVPWQVAEGNRILAADLFKMKDAPFGIAGSADLGVIRIAANPWLVELLRPYVNPRRKVGVLRVCADHGELRRAGPRRHSQGLGDRPHRRQRPVVAAAPKVSHQTPKQHAASVNNLRKARAVARLKPRTAKQKAASRLSLVKARAAQKARRGGKTPVAAKKPQAPDLLTGQGIHSLPVCAAVAAAASLQAWTGIIASAAEVWELYLRAGETSIAATLEAVAEHGLAGARLESFQAADPCYLAPGLLYGVQLAIGYHAVLSAPGGMLSWGNVIPLAGEPEEAWLLEWKDPGSTAWS